MERPRNEREGDGERVVKSIRVTAGLITAIAIILAAIAWAGDARYVLKGEMQKALQYSNDQLRKTTLEDEIFKLSQIPPAERNNEQRAVLERSLRQMTDINTRWTIPPPGGQ